MMVSTLHTFLLFFTISIIVIIQESSVIAEAMERCLFHINSNTKDSYRRHVRKIVFALRYQSEVKERLLANQLPVEEFCQL